MAVNLCNPVLLLFHICNVISLDYRSMAGWCGASFDYTMEWFPYFVDR